jgi:hypothetical protein
MGGVHHLARGSGVTSVADPSRSGSFAQPRVSRLHGRPDLQQPGVQPQCLAAQSRPGPAARIATSGRECPGRPDGGPGSATPAAEPGVHPAGPARPRDRQSQFRDPTGLRRALPALSRLRRRHHLVVEPAPRPLHSGGTGPRGRDDLRRGPGTRHQLAQLPVQPGIARSRLRPPGCTAILTRCAGRQCDLAALRVGRAKRSGDSARRLVRRGRVGTGASRRLGRDLRCGNEAQRPALPRRVDPGGPAAAAPSRC